MNVFIVVGRGPVVLQGPVGTEELQNYDMDNSLNNFRPAQKQLKALREIASIKNGFVFIARSDRKIIGYVIFCPPDPYLKWGNDRIPGLLEFGAIEIGPTWRQEGLGIKLLREVFNTGMFESYLIIAMEYYWHWDIDKSELSIWEYRNMLARVLGFYGFELWKTDDPDVRSHPANTFMVRVGKRVPAEWVERMRTIATSRCSILNENK
jgi:acetoin utilization protein AcuA